MVIALLQDALQGAQEEAVQAAFSVYNIEAVGNGPVRRNYEKQLHATLKRHFEVMPHIIKNDLCLRCSRFTEYDFNILLAVF